MRFAKLVFASAGIWGLLTVTPLYFLFDTVGRAYPPPITHPDFYYGFVGVTLAWQVAFLLIARDPVRFRPLMTAAILEKAGYLAALTTLYAQGRLQPGQFAVVSPDAIFCALFIASFFKTRPPVLAERPQIVSAPFREFPEVRLMPPSTSGFVLLAAQVDRRPPFLGSSARKRKVLQACKRLCLDLRLEPDVLDCTVFRAILVPPGSGGRYVERRGNVHKARFDIVVLLEVASVQLVERILASEPYRALDRCMRDAARDVYQTTASNVKRIGPVDHSRDGVFLFNFFVADRTDQNIAVWHQTAGWFQQETGLDNSTVLLPMPAHRSPYTIINHCRWNRLRDILPALIFKRSFRTYVLAHFDANDTAPMPILYRLA